MAHYQIRQKYFALKDSFAITDASGNARYTCRSKMITIPKKFWLESAGGNPLYFVRKNVFSWWGFPKFKIYKGADKSESAVATVKVKFSFFTKRLKITSDTFGNFFVKGSVMGWTFNIYDKETKEVVATISKKVLKIADTYDIDVFAGNDAFMLTVCIILDFLYHKKH